MTAEAARIAWWPHTRDDRIASYRLRCARIVDHLIAQGVPVRLYEPGASPPLRCLVLSKRYDDASVRHALALREAHGTRVLLDLCDNHFDVASDAPASLHERAARLRRVCQEVGSVVCASTALEDVVRRQAPGVRTYVIPDSAEEPGAAPSGPPWRHPAARLAFSRLRSWLERQGRSVAYRLVWYGNHGSPGVEGGMSDIAARRELIEAAAARRPLTLTVISNSPQAFAQYVRPLRLPTHYLPWHAQTFSAALQLHSVALLPIVDNPFTRCKTANRVLTAALHGLNVVGDSIPSYLPLKDAAVFDDWHYGLGTYLDDEATRCEHRGRLLQRAREEYSLDRVVALWQAALALEPAPR